MLSKYQGAGGDVIVPSEIDGVPVMGIGLQAFIRNNDITSLTISEPVVILDSSAVSSMEALTSVTLPDTLEYIAGSNFYDSSALTSVTIPPRVMMIGLDCFVWCDALESVTFTGGVPIILNGCFRSLADNFVCYVPDDLLDAYKEVLPSGLDVQPSGQNAVIVEPESDPAQFDFDAATGTITAYHGSATRVAVPAEIDGTAVKAIGKRAFEGKDYLCGVGLPDGLELIDDEAFRSCDYLLSVDVPDSVRVIGTAAFGYNYQGEAFDWPAS